MGTNQDLVAESRIQTYDLLIRSEAFYSTELIDHVTEVPIKILQSPLLIINYMESNP